MTFVFFFSLLTASTPLLAEGAATSYSFKVIVHPTNPASTMDSKFLSDIYLKKVTQWPDQSLIYPAELASNSPLRLQFTQQVHHRSIGSVKSYWQHMIFSGRKLPPLEMRSEAEIIKYVESVPGSIGYISPDASVVAVKVLQVN